MSEECTQTSDARLMRPIPISAAKHIAKEYCYDQVIVYARKVGDPNNDWIGGGEHVTTYGKDRANCDVAARIGDHLNYKVFGWTKEGATHVY